MADLKELLAKRSQGLKPTATTVRKRDGTVTIERAAVAGLSEAEQRERMEASQRASKAAEKVEIKPYSEGILYGYQGEEGNWKPWEGDRETMAADPGDGLRVMTFNIWFSPHEWEKRADMLLDLLFAGDAYDVVMLQEVTKRFLGRLTADSRVRQRYVVTDTSGGTFIGGYGNMMLIRRELPRPAIWFVKFPGRMGRRGLVATFENVALATVHLESLNSTRLRLEQLNRLCEVLDQPVAVIAGDFNVAGTGPYASAAEDTAVDAVRSQYGFDDVCAELGLTYDTRESANTMVRAADDQPIDYARYDRVWVRGGLAADRQLVGADGADGLWISDHFGLSFVVSRKSVTSK
mmetsp:Transcript_3654/g.9989  ORF Transcript_3654/g.9989 Transcript_3654/m.9989 type:complete len:349 (+) Transcript_3654:68-1114(+)